MKKIKLTVSQFHTLITESVYKILQQIDEAKNDSTELFHKYRQNYPDTMDCQMEKDVNDHFAVRDLKDDLGRNNPGEYYDKIDQRRRNKRYDGKNNYFYNNPTARKKLDKFYGNGKLSVDRSGVNTDINGGWFPPYLDNKGIKNI